MDRHYSRQSPYQPSAGQVYLDYLNLNGRDSSIDERVRAHELSVRPLSLSELEEHHKRHASLQRYANDHLELVRATENGPFTALGQRKDPPAKTNNGKNCTQPEQPRGVHSAARPRSRPLHLSSQNDMEQQIPDTRRAQQGYTASDISDQERRAARMGLGTQKCYGKGATPHITPALPQPMATSLRSLQIRVPERKPTQQIQEQPKAQIQYSRSPACCSLVQERTNDALLKSQAREEAGRRQQSAQKGEQEMVQKLQLPAAKPGSLYPGPSRIPGTIHPLHAAMHQAILSEIESSVHFKSKLASQEAYLKYKEEGRDLEEKRKGAFSVPGSVSVDTRTESVKRLLANVSKPLQQEVGAVGVEVSDTRGVPNEAFRVQSREPDKRPVDGFGAADEHGEMGWYDYNNGTRRSPSLGFASEQPSKASPDHPAAATVAERSAPQIETVQREAPTSSESSDVRAAIEAIDQVIDDLSGSPKTASGPGKQPEIGFKPLSIKRYGHKIVVHLARVSLATLGKRSFDVSRQDVSKPDVSRQVVSPLPVPQPYQRDMSSEFKMDLKALDAVKLVLVVDNTESGGATESMEDTVVDDTVEDATVEDAIQSGWERIDNSSGDDEWSVVEQDSVDEVSTGGSSSSDMEWALDVDSEGWSDS